MGIPSSRGARGHEVRERQLHPGGQTALSLDAFDREEGVTRAAAAAGIPTSAAGSPRRRHVTAVHPAHHGPIRDGHACHGHGPIWDGHGWWGNEHAAPSSVVLPRCQAAAISALGESRRLRRSEQYDELLAGRRPPLDAIRRRQSILSRRHQYGNDVRGHVRGRHASREDGAAEPTAATDATNDGL